MIFKSKWGLQYVDREDLLVQNAEEQEDMNIYERKQDV